MSNSMDVAVTSGTLEDTGRTTSDGRRQMQIRALGWTLWLYFTPDMARQWIAALSPIAAADRPAPDPGPPNMYNADGSIDANCCASGSCEVCKR